MWVSGSKAPPLLTLAIYLSEWLAWSTWLLPQGEEPPVSTACASLRADLDTVEKRKIIFPCRESKKNIWNLIIFGIRYAKHKVESKGFWRWCTTLRITRFLHFVHLPEF
jgi:hypothetical protein